MTNDAEIKKLEELIKDIRYAMMTTVDNDGTLRSRPMATELREFDGYLWFFTKDDSPKSIELQEDPRVNVSFADSDRNHYVSVSGEAELVHDRAKMRELWNPTYKAWFPDELEDPSIALIRVKVQKAEYWDNPTGKMVVLTGWIKALATGEPAKPKGNKKLDIAS